jgi:hypothetical protein
MLKFTAPEVLERVERRGDLFGPLLSLHQQLPEGVVEIKTAKDVGNEARRKPVREASLDTRRDVGKRSSSARTSATARTRRSA